MDGSNTRPKISQMPLRDTEAVQPPDDTELMERNMRRALGMDGGSAQRTLTIAPGSPRPATAARTTVPGSSHGDADTAAQAGSRGGPLSPLRQLVVELEGKLAAERRRHEEARHLLRRAELTVQGLEARLQREAIAQAEELEAERQTTIKAQRATDETAFEIQQRGKARRAAVSSMQAAAGQAVENHAVAARAQAESVPDDPKTVSDALPAKKRSRPRTRPLPEPKPVRWWTPSYRAKPKG